MAHGRLSMLGIVLSALILVSGCGFSAHPEVPSPPSREVPLSPIPQRIAQTTSVFPLQKSPLLPTQVPATPAAQVAYQYWKQFGQMGSQYPRQYYQQQAYKLFAPELQRVLPFTVWQRMYEDVDYGQLVTLFPTSAHTVFVEAALWIVQPTGQAESVQSIGYQSGFMTVRAGQITQYQVQWENLLGTVYRVQAWPYSLSGSIAVALHTYQHPSAWFVVQHRLIAPGVVQVTVRKDSKQYTMVFVRQVNRMYRLLKMSPT